MLTSRSSLISFRISSWIFLSVLIYFLLVSGIPLEAQTTINKSLNSDNNRKIIIELLNKNPWSDIKGFRSAKLGMGQKSVYRAISKDFKIAKNDVKKEIHSKEKTTSFQIVVPDLFVTGGIAKVVYIFGYKSKKLIHINILWGSGAADKLEDINEGEVLLMADLLRAHFIKKRYQEKELIVNGHLSPNSIIVFRGKDKKGRLILLTLNTLPKQEGQTNEQASGNISLLLSYILNSEKSDIR
jgi:hypothetical protein